MKGNRDDGNISVDGMKFGSRENPGKDLKNLDFVHRYQYAVTDFRILNYSCSNSLPNYLPGTDGRSSVENNFLVDFHQFNETYVDTVGGFTSH